LDQLDHGPGSSEDRGEELYPSSLTDANNAITAICPSLTIDRRGEDLKRSRQRQKKKERKSFLTAVE
jgi:hypothetical protein